jgi:hypothetical protein
VTLKEGGIGPFFFGPDNQSPLIQFGGWWPLMTMAWTLPEGSWPIRLGQNSRTSWSQAYIIAQRLCEKHKCRHLQTATEMRKEEITKDVVTVCILRRVYFKLTICFFFNQKIIILIAIFQLVFNYCNQ